MTGFAPDAPIMSASSDFTRANISRYWNGHSYRMHTILLLAAVMLNYLHYVCVTWIVLYALSVEILGKRFRKPQKIHSNPTPKPN